MISSGKSLPLYKTLSFPFELPLNVQVSFCQSARLPLIFGKNGAFFIFVCIIFGNSVFFLYLCTLILENCRHWIRSCEISYCGRLLLGQ